MISAITVIYEGHRNQNSYTKIPPNAVAMQNSQKGKSE